MIIIKECITFQEEYCEAKLRELPIRNKKDTVNLLLLGNKLKTRLFAFHLPQVKYQKMVVTETRI